MHYVTKIYTLVRKSRVLIYRSPVDFWVHVKASGSITVMLILHILFVGNKVLNLQTSKFGICFIMINLREREIILCFDFKILDCIV